MKITIIDFKNLTSTIVDCKDITKDTPLSVVEDKLVSMGYNLSDIKYISTEQIVMLYV